MARVLPPPPDGEDGDAPVVPSEEDTRVADMAPAVVAAAEELVMAELGARRVADDPVAQAEEVLAERDRRVADVITELRVFALCSIRYRERMKLTPRRQFIVRCPTDAETYLVSAGPRGGSWKGRCPTCGAKAADTPKPEVIEEVVVDETHE